MYGSPSEAGASCAAVADDGAIYAMVHADYSWPIDLVKVDQATGSVTWISSPSWFGYGRCRQGMFIVGDDIYVGTSYESHDKHLTKLKTDGTLVWMAHMMGSLGYGDGRYYMAEDGNIYTGKSGNVLTINPDDGSYTDHGSIRDDGPYSPYTFQGVFSQGAGVYKDKTGALWVASPYWEINEGDDRYWNKLGKIDSATLQVLEVYGGTGTGSQQLNTPGAILPDPLDSGAFYVVDRGNKRLQKFIYNPNQSPVASAGPDQVIECAGPSGASVALNASASSDPDGDTLTYTWAWNGGSTEGVNPTVSLPLGTTVVTLTVSDGKETATDSVNITIEDKTSPVTAATGGSDNWYNTNVISAFSATDSCSGVKEIHYTVNGTETVISGGSASLTLSTDGTYNIAYYSIDNAGNAESQNSMTVKIDKTPPTITGTATTSPNANGWDNTDVTVTFTCTDSASGIAQCPSPVTVSSEGAGQVVSGTAVDKAGNSATASVTLNIDKTPPVLSLSTDPNTLWPPNHEMVDVTIDGSTIDATSGISSVTFSVTDEYGTVQPSISDFNSTIQLEAWREGTDEDGRHYTITAVAADAAGNKTTASTTVLVPHDQGN